MARVETLVASSRVKSPASKFYDLLRNNSSDITSISPPSFKDAKVVGGEDGKEGCVTQWTYVVGGVMQTINLETEEIDDVARSMTFTVVGGDLFVLYKSFKFIVDVAEGLIKVTFAYEKTTLRSPPPTEYVPMIVSVFTCMDAYLLSTS